MSEKNSKPSKKLNEGGKNLSEVLTLAYMSCKAFDTMPPHTESAEYLYSALFYMSHAIFQGDGKKVMREIDAALLQIMADQLFDAAWDDLKEDEDER